MAPLVAGHGSWERVVAGAAISQHSVAARPNRIGRIMLGAPIGVLIGAAHAAEALVSGDVCIARCTGRCVVGVEVMIENPIVEIEVAEVERAEMPVHASHLVFGQR